jgi:hypothetical protein
MGGDVGMTGPDKGKGGKVSAATAWLQGRRARRLLRITPGDIQRL